ncbi:hypothetical protein SCHIN_v1c08800 [Spiroplasma chinense]|uniref:Uncharacterized protein n=1 Tax=Spiroplasma chinense TaxID=216932 RepID=A0A5B9Y5H7_9MOLU|nr:hypothetical protein [Spiroplasma chinense]QEH62075.1 hypothetical protein SCHIN_v1c08800 [Spiroplasma chinense]
MKPRKINVWAAFFLAFLLASGLTGVIAYIFAITVDSKRIYTNIFNPIIFVVSIFFLINYLFFLKGKNKIKIFKEIEAEKKIFLEYCYWG